MLVTKQAGIYPKDNLQLCIHKKLPRNSYVIATLISILLNSFNRISGVVRGRMDWHSTYTEWAIPIIALNFYLGKKIEICQYSYKEHVKFIKFIH